MITANPTIVEMIRRVLLTACGTSCGINVSASDMITPRLGHCWTSSVQLLRYLVHHCFPIAFLRLCQPLPAMSGMGSEDDCAGSAPSSPPLSAAVGAGTPAG